MAQSGGNLELALGALGGGDVVNGGLSQHPVVVRKSSQVGI